MRRIRNLLPILLAVTFWVAQLQGTTHGIGHLSKAASTDAHHSLGLSHCDDCASLAQAGAVPLRTLAAYGAAHGAVEQAALRFSTLADSATAPFYRSRAPPVAPV